MWPASLMVVLPVYAVAIEQDASKAALQAILNAVVQVTAQAKSVP